VTGRSIFTQILLNLELLQPSDIWKQQHSRYHQRYQRQPKEVRRLSVSWQIVQQSLLIEIEVSYYLTMIFGVTDRF
jgi:hypothetical protein